MREGDRILPGNDARAMRSMLFSLASEGLLREGDSSKSVLIVDDDSVLRTILKDVLDMGNYLVTEAASCSEAVRNLDPQFDLALVDYHLPDGNGIDLLGAIRKTNPCLPVIMMTGYGTEDIAVRSFRTGATDYIKKPFTLPFLLRKMAERLWGNEIIDKEDSPESTAKSEDLIMDRVAIYLEENHTKYISLCSLATMFGIGKFRFCRLFKKKFGRGYLSYLNRIRIEHAKELLRNPDLSMVNIAYSTGFGSISQFERVFREAEGLSPKEYKKGLRPAPQAEA